MAGLLGDRISPEMRDRFGLISVGLGQMAQGAPVNLGPAREALIRRQQEAEQRRMLEQSGILERFSPDQRAILAQMEPSAAMQIIAGQAFAQPVDNRTDDMREFELAQAQGFTGTFMDYMTGLRGAGATVINNNMGPQGIDYGDAPTDMAWLRNLDGTVRLDENGLPMAGRITGSKSDREAMQATIEAATAGIDAAEADQARAESTARTGSIVLQDIGRVQDKIEDAPWYSPTAGFFGNIFKNVAGTDAADVKALTTTIRANIGFDRLQQMREASPTGGALGQVTLPEIERLEAVLGSIEQSQSESQLVENLDRLEEVYLEIMRKAAAYPNAADFGFGAAQDDPLGLFR